VCKKTSERRFVAAALQQNRDGAMTRDACAQRSRGILRFSGVLAAYRRAGRESQSKIQRAAVCAEA
jgi:hypothetical protein